MRVLAFLCALLAPPVWSQWAIKGETVYTMAGDALTNGLVLVKDGKIEAVGLQSDLAIPQGYQVKEAKVVTPGFIDAHSVVGLAGYLNQDHDQDQLESSSPMQPELRALDAYNAREKLVSWLRDFGVTTLHTGHGPGALVSGQTMLVKTQGDTVDDAVFKPKAMVAVTLGESGQASGGKPPGTRAKMMAMLRGELIKAQGRKEKAAAAAKTEDQKGKKSKGETKKTPTPEPPALDDAVWDEVLSGNLPLLITADRAQDIANALRLVEEFGIKMVLDSGAEAYLMADHLAKKGIPVVIHPSMTRTFGEKENATMEAAARLVAAGVSVALQSGFESYVPKTRVVLFEAAIAAAYGLSFEQALATITRTPAEILGIADRVGSLKMGMDADLVLFDGDPFEYTSHVMGVFINGELVSDRKN